MKYREILLVEGLNSSGLPFCILISASVTVSLAWPSLS